MHDRLETEWREGEETLTCDIEAQFNKSLTQLGVGRLIKGTKVTVPRKKKKCELISATQKTRLQFISRFREGRFSCYREDKRSSFDLNCRELS